MRQKLKRPKFFPSLDLTETTYTIVYHIDGKHVLKNGSFHQMSKVYDPPYQETKSLPIFGEMKREN